MDINFLILASPLFLLLIIGEYLLSRYKNKALYQLNDTVNNFSSGILEELGALPIKGLIILGYYYVYEHHALFQLPADSILTWVALWLAVDFCYYWFHRSSHRCSFFWIGHSVHHQSEHYNLSVALRQGYLQTLTSWLFYLPLAFIGFSTTMFISVAALNTIYQFWIHTALINKMGWLEKVLNTPSHHRVHHGKNRQYIDKNYAGSLIIWDKLFGTFEPENERVEYGVTEPLDSWNPFHANIKVIKDLIWYGSQLKSKLSLFKAFFMPPEWIILQLTKEKAVINKRTTQSKNIYAPLGYMIFNLSVVICTYTYLSFTFNHHTLSSWLLALFIVYTLYILGCVSNKHQHIDRSELIRSVILMCCITTLSHHVALAITCGLIFIILNQLLFNLRYIKTVTRLVHI